MLWDDETRDIPFVCWRTVRRCDPRTFFFRPRGFGMDGGYPREPTTGLRSAAQFDLVRPPAGLAGFVPLPARPPG